MGYIVKNCPSLTRETQCTSAKTVYMSCADCTDCMVKQLLATVAKAIDTTDDIRIEHALNDLGKNLLRVVEVQQEIEVDHE